ncbi:MAG: substrate-binding domain-containing protein [Saprospiraceae bacterium]|nr:substrate-binding domain-containing protein [Saprospiraceae bacterium]
MEDRLLARYSFWLLALGSMAAACWLSGCFQAPVPAQFTIGFSQCTTQDAWRQTMEAEMRRALSFYPDLRLLPIADAQNDSKRQIEQIRALLAQGIDLLVVSPNEAEPITPLIEEVYARGIPVILLDRRTNSSLYTAYLGGDNTEIGRAAGEYAARLLGEKGEILEIWGLRGSTPAIDRHDGFEAALRRYPGLHPRAQLDGHWEKEAVQEQLPALLQQHPEIDLIFAHNDRMALAAIQVAQRLGRDRSLRVIGVDGLPGPNGGIELVSQGLINATLLYPTGGEEAIRIAADILHHRPFQKENLLQTTLIDNRNVRIIEMQSNKILQQQASIKRQEERIGEQQRIFQNQTTALYVLIASLAVSILLGAWLYKSLIERKEAFRQLEQQKEEILDQRNQILAMSDKAEAATQAQVHFFTNVSHEFRTPLTLILAAVEGLQALGGSRETKQDLGLVRTNAIRLLRLVNQLMDFSKVEQQKMQVRASENELPVFVKELLQAYRKVADKRNIELRFFSREVSLPVWFDVHMLDKVLFNLLSNAFKFTRDGGRIDVVVIKDPIENQAIVKVEDNGSGMSAEHVAHAFERFYQGPVPPAGGGTGLGLSLSRELVQLHGGEILLWSEKGVGTRFEVKLPLGKTHFQDDQLLPTPVEGLAYEAYKFYTDDDEPQPATLPAPPPAQQDPAPEHTLLLIEDNSELRQFLQRKLGKDYQVLEAADGESGLDLACRHVPDLILSDVMMPAREGLSLVKILKSDLRTSHIPVVLLTAKAGMEQKIEGIQTGADAYLTKPFNLIFLQEIIKNLLQSRAALRERFGGNLPADSRRLADVAQIDQQFLQKFRDAVEQQLADPQLSVQGLCAGFGLSRVQLYRKVKSLLGESVNDYIQHARLKKASLLLLEGKHSVAEVAYQVGYSSPGYFATAFKTRYQCSPSEWRERQGKSD